MQYLPFPPGDPDLTVSVPLDPTRRWYYIVAGFVGGRSLRGAYVNHRQAFRAQARFGRLLNARVFIIRQEATIECFK